MAAMGEPLGRGHGSRSERRRAPIPGGIGRRRRLLDRQLGPAPGGMGPGDEIPRDRPYAGTDRRRRDGGPAGAVCASPGRSRCARGQPGARSDDSRCQLDPGAESGGDHSDSRRGVRRARIMAGRVVVGANGRQEPASERGTRRAARTVTAHRTGRTAEERVIRLSRKSAAVLRKTASVPLHPFLLAVYPVLALFAHNTAEIHPAAALRPFAIMLGLGAITLGLSRLVFRDWHGAALLASLAIILFFSYGHVYGFLKPVVALGEVVGRHRYLAVVWTLLAILGFLGIRRLAPPPPRQPGPLTSSINAVPLPLLILPTVQVVSYDSRLRQADLAAGEIGETSIPVLAASEMPDIYYIILDAYTRGDILAGAYGLDNRPFLQELEGRGFTISECSQSNYARTSLSLGSSLNMEYVETFFPRDNTIGMSAFIRHNRVRSSLEQAGYTVVAIDSGYPSTQWSDADVYLQPRGLSALQAAWAPGATEFEGILFRSTAGLILLDAAPSLGLTALIDDAPKVDRYNEIAAAFTSLEEAADVPGPKLVFAHIRIPHDPYLFARDGRFLPDQTAHNPGYPDQVLYVNSRMLPIIDRILQQTEVPPIIVLQGDHIS